MRGAHAGVIFPRSIVAISLLLLLEVNGGYCSESSLRGGSVPALLLETEELTEDPSQPHVKEYAKLELEAEIRAALNGTKADLDGRDKVVDDVVKYSPRYKYRANIPDEPPAEVTSDNFKLPNCSLPGCGESWNQFESGEDTTQQNETSSALTFDDRFDPEVDYEGDGTTRMGGSEIGPARTGRSPFSHFFQWYHCGSCPNGKCPKHCNGHHRRKVTAGCAGQCKELCGAGSWEDGCLKDCLEDCGQGGSTRGEIFRLEKEIAGKTDLCPTNGDCKSVKKKRVHSDHDETDKGGDYDEQLGDLSTDEDISRDERKEDDELSRAASHIQDDERSPIGARMHHKGDRTTFQDIKHIEDQLSAETSDVAEADGTPISDDGRDDSHGSEGSSLASKVKRRRKHSTRRAAHKSQHSHSRELMGEEHNEHHKKKHHKAGEKHNRHHKKHVD